jgi:hypothetical protein
LPPDSRDFTAEKVTLETRKEAGVTTDDITGYAYNRLRWASQF